MNKVILMGRLTADPEIRYSQGQNGEQMAIARFSVAVDRRFKKENDASADFPSCVAFGKTADFVGKYFHKGMKIALEGRLQTGSYEKDGVKHYTTDVIAEAVEFAESKKAEAEEAAQPSTGFTEIPTDIENDLPFI